MQPMARVAVYLRVSTTGQTVENQRLELEAWAGRAGHEVVAVYADEGISGAKGRDRRPEFDRMLKDAVRRKFDLLAHLVKNPGHAGAASPDRGRSETEEWRKRWVFPCPSLSGFARFP